MTTVQRNSLITRLAIEGSKFISGNRIPEAHLCLNLIAGMASDPHYIPSDTMLNQVNIKSGQFTFNQR